MNDRQKWRVVLESGEVRTVVVTADRKSFFAKYGDHGYHCSEPRYGVIRLAYANDWPIAEVLAPGEPTRKEAVKAMYEKCLAVAKEFASNAKYAEKARDLYDLARGCVVDMRKNNPGRT